MKQLRIEPGCTDRTTLEPVIECLRKGGVIAAPTETVFGLMTAWDNEPGRRRIYKLKGRDFDKPLQMLAASLPAAVRLGAQPDERAEILAQRFWPGPLTVVMPAKDKPTIGLRIPDSELILAILELLDAPLAATSANLSGRPPAIRASEIPHSMNDNPDLLITGRNARRGQASTVVSLLERPWKILRRGAISEAEISAAMTAQ